MSETLVDFDIRGCMNMSDQKQTIYCTFCGADDTTRNQMIKTEGATICDECVLLCVKLLVKPKNTGVTPES